MNIFHDHPYEDDAGVRVVILHRRYGDPANGACGRTPEEVEKWVEENSKEWFTTPLFLYDHSGAIYRVGEENPFTCPWDSGRVGIVALKRSEWGDGDFAEYAASIAEAHTAWANGYDEPD